jgi:HD-GYP domain-containing protein (c-di-GMP phosphodiesterase class II)
VDYVIRAVATTKAVPFRGFISRYPGARDYLLHDRENIICRHRQTGRVKQVQYRALHENNPRFWERPGQWEYFLDREVADSLETRIRAAIQARQADHASAGSDSDSDHAPGGKETGLREKPDASGEPAELEELDQLSAADEGADERAVNGNDGKKPTNFGGLAERYDKATQSERVGLLQNARARLDELAGNAEASAEEVAEALVDATRDATLANRAAVMKAIQLGNEQAREYTRQMVIETHKMVKSTMRLVDSAVYNDDLVRAVVEKSNGTVVQHMTRVFLTGLEFLLYYNRQVVTRGIANRIRIRFKTDYRGFYTTLLPHLHDDQVNLEHVFYGGMKALSEVEINKFATGFLVHDVGKADDIEYHEGEAGFNRETVERHVKIGYKAVMDKTSYPREAALITGYHHEYYGDPHGYGYFREFLADYKKANPSATQDYVISYTMEPLIDYEVLAYFPAKMLEIVDVFDSLTDPNRLYRKPLSEEEALGLIRTEFIENNRKIDPILFDVFLDYYREKVESRR